MPRFWKMVAFDLRWGLRILVGLAPGAAQGMLHEALRLERLARRERRRRFGPPAEPPPAPHPVLPVAPERPRAACRLTDRQARDLLVMVAAGMGAIGFLLMLVTLFLHVSSI